MQIKNSFDDVTKQKIKKSFLFYGLPTAIIAGISYYLKTQNIVESILAGVIAGLFNANLYGGIFAYVALHLIITVFIIGSVGKIEQYFMKKS
jgi:hypothetical protein